MAIQKIFVITSYNNLTTANVCDFGRAIDRIRQEGCPRIRNINVEDIEGVINSHFNEAFSIFTQQVEVERGFESVNQRATGVIG